MWVPVRGNGASGFLSFLLEVSLCDIKGLRGLSACRVEELEVRLFFIINFWLAKLVGFGMSQAEFGEISGT